MRVTARFEQEEDWFGISERTMSRFVREALKTAVEYRHKKYMPLHFRMAAYIRHPNVYRRRSGDSNLFAEGWGWAKGKRVRIRQWSRFKGVGPLRWNGDTERMVLGEARFTASKRRGSSTITARATMPVPSYLKYIKRWGYDPSAELQATNAQEMRKMLVVFRDVLRRLVTTHRGQRRRRRL